MDFVSSNRSLMGFNLSFFVNEIDLMANLFDAISEFLKQGQLQVPHVVEMDMKDISKAHDLIQSGKSVGKIIMQTNIKIE